MPRKTLAASRALAHAVAGATALAAALTIAAAAPADACTRAVYLGPEGRILTGRSMDWKLPMVSNLWVFPRGMARDGAAGERSATWISRYGSLVVSGYDISTADGMNEAGLVVNLLWEVEATYPEDDGTTPRISLSVLPQYLLDRYATVTEAASDLRENAILVQGGEVPVGPPGRAATVHVSISDATGDSAIIEFVNGEMTIWHNRSYQIMTNEPTYDRQLAIREYWDGVNPREFLPGTVRATDRFVRANFYINAVEQTSDPRRAAASVFSVIRQVSVPWGISVADQPNLSTTRWRVVADHLDRRYYVESVTSPSVFWVDLTRLDFSEGAKVMKLDLGVDMQRILAGESSASFEPARPFAFQPAD
jgi:choloylglycine hydrolase